MFRFLLKIQMAMSWSLNLLKITRKHSLFNFLANFFNKIIPKNKLLFLRIICDLGRIQTCNLLSRNQVHYSVMLRGLYRAANIT